MCEILEPVVSDQKWLHKELNTLQKKHNDQQIRNDD